MTVLRIPSTAWRWHGTLLVLMLLAVPTLAVIELVPAGDQLARVAAVRTVVIAAGLLVASVSLYLHSRITDQDVSGWLSLAIGLAAVPTLTYGVYCFSHPEAISGALTHQVGYRLVQMLITLGVLLLARRRLRVDALALALALGLALAVARRVTLGDTSDAHASSATVLIAAALLGSATLATGLPILGIAALPAWLRARSFLALGLLGASTTLDPLSTTDRMAAVLGLVTAVSGSVLVASTSAAYVHLTLIHRRTEIADLEAALARVESGLEADRVRLHEIDSTLAGIASASRLIRTTPDISASRRDVLEGMMAAEMARLQRLTADRPAGRPDLVALDDVIGRVALQHRAQGCGVEWQVTGTAVTGSAAALAEVLDVLLHNAARHGDPERVRVMTDDLVREVQVSVVDDGPGVPLERRSSLFGDPVPDADTGPPAAVDAHPARPRGLLRARGLARSMGGDLWLADSEAGATFVIRLVRADDAPETPDRDGAHAVSRGGSVSC